MLSGVAKVPPEGINGLRFKDWCISHKI